jgi:hypothetical protein
MWNFLKALRIREDRYRTLPYVDPLRAGRHPFQTYLLALCVVSSAPYFWGAATAEAVERHLPVPLAAAWGVTLCVGAITALVGTRLQNIDLALTMERVGLYFTGIDGVVYALCILASKDPVSPFFALGLFVGAGLIRMPLPHTLRGGRTEGVCTFAGAFIVVAGAFFLVISPAIVVAAGATIIFGFGVSCLRRAQDIAGIFKRAKQKRDQEHSPRVLREGEGA